MNPYMTELDIQIAKQTAMDKVMGSYQKIPVNYPSAVHSLESMDELLKRDEQREKDGFKKKVRIGRILTGPGKVVMVPRVAEEKLYHTDWEPNGENGQGLAGKGKGEVGDVVAEKPLFGEDEG